MLAVEPESVKDPIVLFEIDTDPALPELMPNVVPPVPVVVTVIDPVPVPLPMILPDVVPILTFPATMYIPHQIPGSVEAVLVDNQLKLAIALFWTLLAVVVPTFIWIPTKRYAAAVPVTDHGVPPAFAADPPIAFPDTVKLLPDVLLTRMA